MIKFPLALLLCPVLLIACGTSPTSESQSKPGQKTSKDSEVKNPSTPDGGAAGHSGSNPGTSPNVGADDGEGDEKAIPPQAVTGAALTCGKPHILDSALNIDCMVKSATGDRVTLSDLGPRIDYGVDSTEKDDDVLVSVLEAQPDAAYDVRYAVRAKDVTKIDRIIDSSTFYVKVFDDKGEEVKGAVKSFFGIDLEMPTVAEMKKAFLDKTEEIRDIIGL